METARGKTVYGILPIFDLSQKKGKKKSTFKDLAYAS